MPSPVPHTTLEAIPEGCIDEAVAKLGLSREAIIERLASNLGNAQSGIREDSLSRLSDWIFEGQLTEKETGDLASKLVEQTNRGLGDTSSDSVFLRSFSALALAAIIERDVEQPFLLEPQFKELLSSTLTLLRSENNFTGFESAEKGWAHSLAHTADLLHSFLSNPKTTESQVREILAEITARVRGLESNSFYYDEDERLVIAVLTGMQTGLITESLFSNWLAELSKPPVWQKLYFSDEDDTPPWVGAYETKESAKRFSDVKGFLKTLYFQLAFRGDMSVNRIVYLPIVERHLRDMDNGFYDLEIDVH